MGSHNFCLVIDELAAGASVSLPPAPARAIYVAAGAARLESDLSTAALAENSAWHGPGEAAISTAGGVTVLRWELVLGRGNPAEPRGEGLSSRVALAAPVDLEDGAYLLRCDRVDFPPGGTALLHTHQGPGIRCLLKGAIRIDTAGTTHGYRPLEAWFESGPEPVFAAASETEPSAFARVMILPATLRGKSSIRYVNPEDQAKPKSQRYQVFIDRPIDIRP